MYELKIQDTFAAAHRLRGYRGQCEDLHGHNWKVEITVRADRLDEIGLAIDFSDLKAVTEEVLDRLDHTFLNDISPFDTVNPSSENIAAHIFREISCKIDREGLWVYRVTAWESEKACASFLRD